MRINAKNVRGTIMVWAGSGAILAACAQSPEHDPSLFGEGCETDENCQAAGTDPSSEPEPEDRVPEGETDGPSGGHDSDDGNDGGGDKCREDSRTSECDGDPNGGDPSGGDDGTGPSEPDLTCCETEEQICLDGGDSSSVCSSIRQMCETDTCEQLVDVCAPTTVPVSRGCARAYYACFGFRINKCQRESYNSCFAALGDPALCESWDASCSARETYCSNLVSAHPSAAVFEYYCTDWGHEFDPCWEQYLACTDGPSTCENELVSCADTGKLYDAWSCNSDWPDTGDDDGDDDDDEPTDPG